MLHQRTGLPVVTLRPALMYGPGQDESFFIPGLIAACLTNRVFAMKNGEQTREYLYISDLVDASLAAATAPAAPGLVLNIGSGIEYRIDDVAALIMSLAGSGMVSVGSRSERERGLQRLVCDPGRALQVLGWRPRVSIQEGLAATVEWFRAGLDRRAGAAARV
jgi:UDP-glucose 4-epimerase